MTPPAGLVDGDEDGNEGGVGPSEAEAREECGKCGRAMLPPSGKEPAPPISGGWACLRKDLSLDFPVIQVWYQWSPVDRPIEFCLYQILKSRDYFCIMSGSECYIYKPIRDDEDWHADKGGSPPGVLGVGGIEDLPPFDRPGYPPRVRGPDGVARPTPLTGELSELWEEAEKEGKTDLWLLYVRCTDFWSYLFDMQTCELLQFVDWHVVIREGLDKRGRRVDPAEKLGSTANAGRFSGKHQGYGSWRRTPAGSIAKEGPLSTTCAKPKYTKKAD